MNKRAFTLIEVALSMIAATVLSLYIYKSYIEKQYQTSIISLQNEIREFIRYGVIDKRAYVSGTGGFLNTSNELEVNLNDERDSGCSPNLNYTGINAFRLAKCNSWQERFDIVGFMLGQSDDIDTDIDESIGQVPYWGRLIPKKDEFMYKYGKCGIEIRGTEVQSLKNLSSELTYQIDNNITGNPLEFELFIDCSGVSYNDRSHEFIEDAIRFVFEVDFSDIVQEITPNANGMDSVINVVDDVHDGKIKARFRL